MSPVVLDSVALSFEYDGGDDGLWSGLDQEASDLVLREHLAVPEAWLIHLGEIEATRAGLEDADDGFGVPVGRCLEAITAGTIDEIPRGGSPDESLVVDVEYDGLLGQGDTAGVDGLVLSDPGSIEVAGLVGVLAAAEHDHACGEECE